MIAEEQVHVDRAADIGLSMVAEDHERRLIEFAVTANRFDDHGEFLVVFFQLRFNEIVINSVLVPNRVQIAHFNEHQVRLAKVAKDIRRQRHGKQVEAPVPSF